MDKNIRIKGKAVSFEINMIDEVKDRIKNAKKIIETERHNVLNIDEKLVRKNYEGSECQFQIHKVHYVDDNKILIDRREMSRMLKRELNEIFISLRKINMDSEECYKNFQFNIEDLLDEINVFVMCLKEVRFEKISLNANPKDFKLISNTIDNYIEIMRKINGFLYSYNDIKVESDKLIKGLLDKITNDNNFKSELINVLKNLKTELENLGLK